LLPKCCRFCFDENDGGACGGHSCLKTFVITINIIFVLFGLGLTYAGAYILLNDLAAIDPGFIMSSGYILLGVGLFTCMLSMLGAYGARYQKKCPLTLYMVFVFLVMVTLVFITYMLFTGEAVLGKIKDGDPNPTGNSQVRGSTGNALANTGLISAERPLATQFETINADLEANVNTYYCQLTGPLAIICFQFVLIFVRLTAVTNVNKDHESVLTWMKENCPNAGNSTFTAENCRDGKPIPGESGVWLHCKQQLATQILDILV